MSPISSHISSQTRVALGKNQKGGATPTTVAGSLRLFFHYCILNGYDASILLSSTGPFNTAERDANINLSLPSDTFDLITHAKTALNLACLEIVSCADILAVATRDLVTMVGGPYYNIPLGRKDYRISKSYYNLPRGLGLLESNHTLYNDPATKQYVDLYARNETKFFQDFARAMEKLSVYGVKTGRREEIRRRCDAIN